MTNDKMVAEHYSTKVSIMLRDVKGDILNRYPFSVFSQEELRQQRKKQLYDIGDRVMTFFNDEGSVKHGFEQREGQQRYETRLTFKGTEKTVLRAIAVVSIGVCAAA